MKRAAILAAALRAVTLGPGPAALALGAAMVALAPAPVAHAQTDPPAQVTGVSVTALTGRLQVDWTAVSGADGYKVQWKSGTDEYSAADRQTEIGSGTTVRSILYPLVGGTSYTVRVIATKSGANDGTPSAEATGTPTRAAPRFFGITNAFGKGLLPVNSTVTGLITVWVDFPGMPPPYGPAGVDTSDLVVGQGEVLSVARNNLFPTITRYQFKVDIRDETPGELLGLTFSADAIDEGNAVATWNKPALNYRTAPELTVTLTHDATEPATGDFLVSATFSVGVNSESGSEPLVAGSIPAPSSVSPSHADFPFRVTNGRFTRFAFDSGSLVSGAGNLPKEPPITFIRFQVRPRANFEGITTICVPLGRLAPGPDDGRSNTKGCVEVRVDTRPRSADATLSALTLTDTADSSAVTLAPTFAAGTTAYTAGVSHAVDEVTVTPTTTHAAATVAYLDGTDEMLADSDTTEDGQQVSLAVGDTVIKVKVTAQDTATTETYAVTVTRAPPPSAALRDLVLTHGAGTVVTLTPAFASETTSYEASVGHAVTRVTVTPTLPTGEGTPDVAYLDDNDDPLADADGMATGQQVDLAVGATLIKVKVTATDGMTTATYTVRVTRRLSADATLSALTLTNTADSSPVTLAPAFAAGTTAYTAGVAHAVDEVAVTPTTTHGAATVAYLDGTGADLADADTNEAGQQVSLAVGATVIRVRVTAADRVTTATYTVTVTRRPAVAPRRAAPVLRPLLRQLTLSEGTLDPVFAPATRTYAATVPGAVPIVTVLPVTAPHATVDYLDGAAAARPDADPAAPGRQVALAVGENVIVLRVRAPGRAEARYRVTVTRLADMPVGLHAVPGDRRVTLRWEAPASDGGTAILHYEYRYAAGTSVPETTAWTPVDEGLTVTVPDLTNGTEFAFEVRAVYRRGRGAAARVAATPVAAPGAPERLAAVPGDRRVTLRWEAPASDGGTAILRYEYRRDGGAWTDAGTALAATVTGLAGSRSYRFEVRAVNAVGAGEAAQVTVTVESYEEVATAWAVRFGRTVGSQVVDALGDRRAGGATHVTVAGIRLTGPPAGAPEPEAQDPFALPAWATAQLEEEARSMTGRDLVLGTSFHLASAGGADTPGPAFTAWGHVARAGFEGGGDGVTLDGDVTTGLVGFDAEWDRALAGVMLSRSTGDGGYARDAGLGGDAGRVESDLTGVYPYARLDPNARVSAWAVVGAGSGELTLESDRGASMPGDLSMRMGALGLEGRVLDGTAASGIGLDVRSDALWVRTKTSRRSGAMTATEGDVTRLRVIVRGERAFAAGGGATFTPNAEVGVRHDGGDAETGAGLEVGVGARYGAGALTVEGRVRGLLAHEASGYQEWGASGSVQVAPGRDGRGLTLSIAPAWGDTGSASERLWSARDARGLGAGTFEGRGRIDMEAGYGFGFGPARGVLTPWAGATFREGASRTMRMGARWRLGPDTMLGLEGRLQERADGASGEVKLRAALRF